MESLDNNHLEIEVKFHISDIKLLRQRLLALNCVSKGRVFEKNIRLDDKNSSLLKNRSLLRLRQDNTNHLTFKATPGVQDKEFKVMTEHEVVVSDFESALNILISLGFNPVQQYDKWRETFILGSTQLLIDTLPYGSFLEIEGEKPHIHQLAMELGLNWDHRILLNYLAMFEIIKNDLGLAFNDVTFENFEAGPADLSRFLPLFYADQGK